MITSRINLSSLVFISLFIIFNVNQGLSLKCYHCTSTSNETCWTDVTKEDLIECTEETNTTTTAPSVNETTVVTSPPTTVPTTPPTTVSTTPTTVSTTPTTVSTVSSSAPPSENPSVASPSVFHNTRLRRSADARAEENWECVKLINKEDVETVTRKCVKKNANFCNGKDENTCFVCSDKDGCNSASSIGFQFISMILPVAVALFLAR